MRSLRSVFRLTREAVALATQPFAKRMRALAMSISSENTGVPTASMVAIGAPHDGLHDVDVVDHEIEHHVHVRAALAVGREAVALDEARRVQIRLGGQDRCVEALEMPDLQDAPGMGGKRDQLARLGGRLGDRLLDQHVRAGGEEVACDREVRRRRRDDAHRIDRTEQARVRGERRDVQLRADGRARRGVRIDDRHELARFGLRVFLRVKAPEIAHADDGGSDFAAWGGYYARTHVHPAPAHAAAAAAASHLRSAPPSQPHARAGAAGR